MNFKKGGEKNWSYLYNSRGNNCIRNIVFTVTTGKMLCK